MLRSRQGLPGHGLQGQSHALQGQGHGPFDPALPEPAKLSTQSLRPIAESLQWPHLHPSVGAVHGHPELLEAHLDFNCTSHHMTTQNYKLFLDYMSKSQLANGHGTDRNIPSGVQSIRNSFSSGSLLVAMARRNSVSAESEVGGLNPTVPSATGTVNCRQNGAMSQIAHSSSHRLQPPLNSMSAFGRFQHHPHQIFATGLHGQKSFGDPDHRRASSASLAEAMSVVNHQGHPRMIPFMPSLEKYPWFSSNMTPSGLQRDFCRPEKGPQVPSLYPGRGFVEGFSFLRYTDRRIDGNPERNVPGSSHSENNLVNWGTTGLSRGNSASGGLISTPAESMDSLESMDSAGVEIKSSDAAGVEIKPPDAEPTTVTTLNAHGVSSQLKAKLQLRRRLRQQRQKERWPYQSRTSLGPKTASYKDNGHGQSWSPDVTNSKSVGSKRQERVSDKEGECRPDSDARTNHHNSDARVNHRSDDTTANHHSGNAPANSRNIFSTADHSNDVTKTNNHSLSPQDTQHHCTDVVKEQYPGTSAEASGGEQENDIHSSFRCSQESDIRKSFRCSQESDIRKSFRCSQCRYVTDRKNNLKRHVVTMHHTSARVLECCGALFSSKASLRDHVTLFHRGGYRCQVCGRNFCRKALLRRHLTVHSGQKDFACHLCGYATSHKSNLERHQRVHARKTDYVTSDQSMTPDHIVTPGRNTTPHYNDILCHSMTPNHNVTSQYNAASHHNVRSDYNVASDRTTSRAFGNHQLQNSSGLSNIWNDPSQPGDINDKTCLKTNNPVQHRETGAAEGAVTERKVREDFPNAAIPEYLAVDRLSSQKTPTPSVFFEEIVCQQPSTQDRLSPQKTPTEYSVPSTQELLSVSLSSHPIALNPLIVSACRTEHLRHPDFSDIRLSRSTNCTFNPREGRKPELSVGHETEHKFAAEELSDYPNTEHGAAAAELSDCPNSVTEFVAAELSVCLKTVDEFAAAELSVCSKTEHESAPPEANSLSFLGQTCSPTRHLHQITATFRNVRVQSRQFYLPDRLRETHSEFNNNLQSGKDPCQAGCSSIIAADLCMRDLKPDSDLLNKTESTSDCKENDNPLKPIDGVAEANINNPLKLKNVSPKTNVTSAKNSLESSTVKTGFLCYHKENEHDLQKGQKIRSDLPGFPPKNKEYLKDYTPSFDPKEEQENRRPALAVSKTRMCCLPYRCFRCSESFPRQEALQSHVCCSDVTEKGLLQFSVTSAVRKGCLSTSLAPDVSSGAL